ncbi:MAG: hypothetical protein BCS36_07410 [Desulfovibrio sp. MES5]|uniref:hypothetical protein n=1 Tax=Desulfovibrio sp. MES5 TaxID=1899016 RepID=UPI000B9CCD14|nr:hypothetical protein [Desulfovibrio sp. MES5]OXS29544.1 MAG: hypothetical protein BCS36_07410 [Desulfovibrio sp. MES5]
MLHISIFHSAENAVFTEFTARCGDFQASAALAFFPLNKVKGSILIRLHKSAFSTTTPASRAWQENALHGKAAAPSTDASGRQ